MPVIQLEKLQSTLKALDNFELTPSKPPPLSQQQQQPLAPIPVVSSDATWARRYKAFRGQHLWNKKVTNHSNVLKNRLLPTLDENTSDTIGHHHHVHEIQSTNSEKENTNPHHGSSSSTGAALDAVASVLKTTRSLIPPFSNIAATTHHRFRFRPEVVDRVEPQKCVTSNYSHEAISMHEENDDNDASCCSPLLHAEHAKKKDKLRRLLNELEDDWIQVDAVVKNDPNSSSTTNKDEKALMTILTDLMAITPNYHAAHSDNKQHDDDDEEHELEELRRYKATLESKLRDLQEEAIEIDKDTQRIEDWSELKVLSQQALYKTPCQPRCRRSPLSYHDDNSSNAKGLKEWQQDRQNSPLRPQNSKDVALPPYGKVHGDPAVIHYLFNLVKQVEDCTILSLEDETSTALGTAADDKGASIMTLIVRLWKRHSVEIRLRVTHGANSGRNENAYTTRTKRPDPLVVQIQKAKLVTSTYLRGRTSRRDENQQSNHVDDEKNQQRTDIVLEIPPFDDLVQMISRRQHVQGGGLLLLLQEIKLRIETTQLRVRELSWIEKRGHAILSKIGPIIAKQSQQHSDDSNELAFSGPSYHQRVICIIPEQQLQAVLLLTQDCPRQAGSVTLDELFIAKATTAKHHFAAGDDVNSTCASTTSTTRTGFWEANSRNENEEILDEIRLQLWKRQHEFASPVALIQAIQRHATHAIEAFRRARYQENKERRKKQQQGLVGASSTRRTSHLPKRRIYTRIYNV